MFKGKLPVDILCNIIWEFESQGSGGYTNEVLLPAQMPVKSKQDI